MHTKRWLQIGATIMVACGLIVGGALLNVTWEHNPQDEFHEEGVIHWGHWLMHGAAGFVVGAMLGVLLTLLAALLAAVFQRATRA
ncbi:MAG: hypothetical protein RLZZ618_516 [Pseudomonadota bacterium]